MAEREGVPVADRLMAERLVTLCAPADCVACCVDGVVYRVDAAGMVTVPPTGAESLLAHRFMPVAEAASPAEAGDGDALDPADAVPLSPKRRR